MRCPEHTTNLSATPGRPACPSRASGCSSRTTPWGFPCFVRFPCVHAAATTPAQRPNVSLRSFHPDVSVFPDRVVGSFNRELMFIAFCRFQVFHDHAANFHLSLRGRVLHQPVHEHDAIDSSFHGILLFLAKRSEGTKVPDQG